jgi:predicted phosphoadenosine phosphosulfate sulfurtransferase
MTRAVLVHLPSLPWCCVPLQVQKQGSQVAKDWNLWNYEPK